MSTRTDTVATLRATWSALDAVAASLTAEQWAAQSLCPDWTARGVLVHATTIEQVLVGWKPGSEAPFAGIAPVHAELNALEPGGLLERFRSVVAERTAELGAMSDDDFATPGVTPVGPGTYGRFMAIRVFDNWVHERDIRVPLGIPGDDSGPAAEMSLDEVEMSLGYIVGKKIGLGDGKGMRSPPGCCAAMLVKVDGRAAVAGTGQPRYHAQHRLAHVPASRAAHRPRYPSPTAGHMDRRRRDRRACRPKPTAPQCDRRFPERYLPYSQAADSRAWRMRVR
jgi:uncharacterized protein (TIGR03083 family)